MRIKIFLPLLVLLMFSSGVQAQLFWTVSHTDNDWRYQNNFQALSCFGDQCTAAGMTLDFLWSSQTMMFWRSTDGGNRWEMQDPNLSSFNGSYLNEFTKVQQIDSLNVVAIGKYGVIFRTFDAGNIWEQQDCKTDANLSDVHFSDPLTGIITSADSANPIMTTIDGGRNWNPITFHFLNAVTQNGFSACHAFGNGKFSVLASGIGPIWSTPDNWKTAQSSNPMVDPATDSTWSYYYFTHCNFWGKDTLIAYGSYFQRGDAGAITRSVDGGMHWEKPFLGFADSNLPVHTITNMTHSDRDTVLAGFEFQRRFLLSTDKGKSWGLDSLALDTNYNATVNQGLDWTNNGLLAIYSPGSFISIIIKGRILKSAVKTGILKDNSAFISPNPARSDVLIHSNSSFNSVSIFDLLGREVRHELSYQSEDIRISIQGLPKGIYAVVSYNKVNAPQEFGKLIISQE